MTLKIKYQDFEEKFPSRNNILNITETYSFNNELSEFYDNNATIIFRPSNVLEKHHKIYNKKTKKSAVEYCIHMFGSLINGENVHVVIKNCPLYIDIFPTFSKTQFADNISDGLMNSLHSKAISKAEHVIKNAELKKSKSQYYSNDNQVLIKSIKVVYLKRALRGFDAKFTKASRIYFYTSNDRDKAIQLLAQYTKMKITANEEPEFDVSDNEIGKKNTYNIIARQNKNFSLVDILKISNYDYCDKNKMNVFDKSWSKFEHNIEVDFKNISTLDIENDIDDQMRKDLAVNKNIMMTWDSETERPESLEKEAYESIPFMYGFTIHHLNVAKPIAKIVISSVDINEMDDYYMVICDNEAELLLCVAKIIKVIQPTMIIGHNDREFDWKVTIKRLKIHEKISEFYDIINYLHESFLYDPSKKDDENYIQLKKNRRYCNSNIKINADLMLNHKLFDFNGIVLNDVSARFRMLNGKLPKYNLNFICKVNGLDSKEYMPYNLMWDIHESKNPQKMMDVAKYCVVDALRCQEYYCKISIVNDMISMSSLSKTSFKCGATKANSHKVTNIICSYFNPNNLSFAFAEKEYVKPSDKKKTKGKSETIVGGMVRKVKLKELNRKIPLWALDFTSLYPSIIMGYNLSFEMFIYDIERKEELEAQGYDLYHVNVRTTHGRMLEAWTVRHGDDESKMGYMASMELDFFNKRRLITKSARYNYLERFLQEATPEWINENKQTFDEYCMEYSLMKSKQLAIKCFMNTVYGVAAQTISPFYNIYLSGAITNEGQNQATIVGNLLKDNGHTVVYGDTDSAYAMADIKHYIPIYDEFINELFKLGYSNNGNKFTIDECIKFIPENYSADNEMFAEFKRIKLKWATDMVEKSFEIVKKETNIVNNHLKLVNKTKFLSVAYEEVLFPSKVFMKKNYAGLGHIDKINFSIDPIRIPKNIFVRGIDAVKQGFEQFLVDTTWIIFRKMFDIFNVKEVEEIILETLKEAFDKYSDINNVNYESYMNMFIKTATYKPHKKNIKILNFINRMRQEREYAICIGDEKRIELYTVPEDNSKFNFTMVKKKQEYNIKGNKIKIDASMRMEFPHIVKAYNMDIDYEYFIVKSFGSTCAKLLSHKKEFEIENDENDKKAKKIAKQYIIDKCKEWSVNNYDDEGKIGANGISYLNYYKSFVRELCNQIKIEYFDKYGLSQLCNLLIKCDNNQYSNVLTKSCELLAGTSNIPSIPDKFKINANSDVLKEQLKIIYNEKYNLINNINDGKYNNICEQFINFISNIITSTRNDPNVNDQFIHNTVKNIINDNSIMNLIDNVYDNWYNLLIIETTLKFIRSKV